MKRILIISLICALCALIGCAPAVMPAPTPIVTVTPGPPPAVTPGTSPTISPGPIPGEIGLRIAPEKYPRVDGSTATLPLSLLLAERITGVSDPDTLSLLVEHSGTSSAYQNLRWGDAKLLIVYEADLQTKRELEIDSLNWITTPIGRDALVFLTNEANPVDSLTVGQVRQIYAGEITNWNEVGGSDAPILAFRRNATSGSQALMEKLVMNYKPMADAPADMLPIGDMGELVDAVAAYDNSANALGYSVYYYVNNMYLQPGIKLLSIDGTEPNNDTIRSGAYPLTNDFYAIISDEAFKDSRERLLFEYLTGRQGRALIREAGYVELGEEP